MGLLIENHPKMVKMWADRCAAITQAFGHKVANDWANSMFDDDQFHAINKELQERKDKSKKV